MHGLSFILLTVAAWSLVAAGQSPCGLAPSQEENDLLSIIGASRSINGSLTIPAGLYTHRVLPVMLTDAAQVTLEAGARFVGSCSDSSNSVSAAFVIHAASSGVSVTGGVFADFVTGSPIVVAAGARLAVVASANFEDNVVGTGVSRNASTGAWSIQASANLDPTAAGALAVGAGASVTINTVQVTRCGSSGAGAISVGAAASLTANALTISNSAGAIAGAIVQQVASTVTLNSATISDTQSLSDSFAYPVAGAISTGLDASLTLNGGFFLQCVSSATGAGAIAAIGATEVVANGVTFDGNRGVSGGAVLAGGHAAVTLKGACVLKNNQASLSGGAIALTQGASLKVESGACTFSANEAQLDGGDVSVTDTASAWLGASVHTGSSAPVGGTFAAHGRTTVTLDGTLVSGVTGLAGAIGLADGRATVTLLSVTLDNAVAVRAAAVLVRDLATLTVRDSTISNMRTNTHGGAFAIDDQASLLMDNSAATNNWAAFGGVVAGGSLSTIMLNNCSMSGNVATWSGGAVHAEDYTVLAVTGGTYTNNAAVRGGGGVFGMKDRVASSFLNTSCTNNFAPFGGAVNVHGPVTFDAHGSTFDYNEATEGDVRPSGEGGAVHVDFIIHENLANTRVPATMKYSKTLSRFVFGTLNASLPASLLASNANLMTRLQETPSELANGRQEHTSFSYNQAVYGGALYLNDFDRVQGNTTYINNRATLDGGALVVWWGHFREDDPIFSEGEPWAQEVSLGSVKIIGNDAGRKGGHMYVKMLKTPARDGRRWTEARGSFADGTGSQVINNTALVAGHVYFADVKIDEINEVFTVYGLLLELNRPGTYNNVGRLYGDVWSSDKFKLFLRWDFLGTQSAPISVGQGGQLVIPLDIEMVDMTHSRVADNFDLVNLTVGACVDRSSSLALSATSDIELVASSVKFNLANGVASWPAMRVYGKPGTYCVYVSPGAADNIVYRLSAQFTMEECTGIEVKDGSSDAGYTRCMEEIVVRSGLQVGYTVSGSVLLFIFLVTIVVLVVRRTGNIVVIVGLPTLLLIAIGMMVGLVVPVMWDIAASKSTCLLLIWVSHICFALVMTPIVVKLLHLSHSKSVNNVSLQVPASKVIVPTVVALLCVFVYLLVWSLADSTLGVTVVFNTDTDTAFHQCAYNAVANAFILTIEALVLLWSLYIVWATRHLTTMFSESTFYYAIVACTSALCLIAAVTYTAVLESRAAGQYSAAGGVMLFVAFAILCFMYLPILIKLYTKSWMDGGHHLFLSYSKGDKKVTQQLARALTAKGFGVYVDEVRSDAGASWRREVAQHLRASQYVLFVVSPESVQSSYCQEEIQFAYDNKIQILPIIVNEGFSNVIDHGLDMLIKRFQWTMFTTPGPYGFEQGLESLLMGLRKLESQRQTKMVMDGVVEMREGSHVALTKTSSATSHDSVLGSGGGGGAGGGAADSNGVGLTGAKGSNNALAQLLKAKELFLSWSHRDGEFTKERLWPDLESHNHGCWIDCMGLASGDAWRREIGQAISGCETLLFVLTPRSAESQYCMEEVFYAKSQNKKVIVLLLEDSTRVLSLPNSVEFTELLMSYPVIDFLNIDTEYYESFDRLLTLLSARERTMLTAVDGDAELWTPVAQAMHNMTGIYRILQRGAQQVYGASNPTTTARNHSLGPSLDPAQHVSTNKELTSVVVNNSASAGSHQGRLKTLALVDEEADEQKVVFEASMMSELGVSETAL